MFSVQKCAIPPNSFLENYSVSGTYTDCYCTDVAAEITFLEFIAAFYTTPLFKLERWILAWSVNAPSSDKEAYALADGRNTTFAAWHVESRSENQILMCDLNNRTCSWLMSTAIDESRTRLYFGSAVVPVQDPRTGKVTLGFIYQSLLGFHQYYSMLLLYSAERRIHTRSSIGKSRR